MLTTHPQVSTACCEPGVVPTDLLASRAHGQQDNHLPQISQDLHYPQDAGINNAGENPNWADRRDPEAFGGVDEDGQRYH